MNLDEKNNIIIEELQIENKLLLQKLALMNYSI